MADKKTNKKANKKDNVNPDKFTWKPDDIVWEDDNSTDNNGGPEPSKGWLGQLDKKIQRDIGNNGK